ncbi:glycosyltransferase [Kineococcus terrestris]|uniref:glycosyltransferase n=1 Tax=Kineococcus terrestris TaxID=2044856 RepID=UPI0034DB2F12
MAGTAEDARTGSVAVYRRTFLPRSETFVRDHLLALRRYRPTAVTTYPQPDGLQVPGVPLVLADDRRLLSRARRRLPRRWRADQLDTEERGLAAALGTLRPDLLHTHFGTDGAVALGAARRAGVPSVVTFHGYDATTYPESVAKTPVGQLMLDRWDELVAGTGWVIAVSDFVRRELVRRGAREDRIAVVPCGVDPRTFRWSPPDASGRLLFVGRLVEKKGCADLLRALAAHPGLPPLDVLGDGPLRGDLEGLAGRLGVDVRFHGMADRETVLRHLESCSVVVMPSRRSATGDTEGLPVTSLEASACGRPVVGYAHSGLVDSVLSGRTGELVTEGDVAALGEALTGLLADPARLLEQSRAARAHVEANFDIVRTTAAVEEVYDRAVSAG